MNDSGVSKTYASALLGATNVPEEVEQELGDLAQLLFKDEKGKKLFFFLLLYLTKRKRRF
ncbi:Uncharacterized protein GNX_1261 [Leptospira interrogans serovar Canicola]|nr:Uncharacterized protein GNX_1261 [Leptospira interrogans serovar Canicola]